MPKSKIILFLQNMGILVFLSVLSFKIYAEWKVEYIQDKSVNKKGCYLLSPATEINDGYQDISIYLMVNRKKVLVVTPSNIDISYSDTKMTVDKKTIAVPARVLKKQYLVYTDRIDKIIEHFKAGRSLVLSMRFWPSWPSKGLRKIRISLLGFKYSFSRLDECK